MLSTGYILSVTSTTTLRFCSISSHPLSASHFIYWFCGSLSSVSTYHPGSRIPIRNKTFKKTRLSCLDRLQDVERFAKDTTIMLSTSSASKMSGVLFDLIINWLPNRRCSGPVSGRTTMYFCLFACRAAALTSSIPADVSPFPHPHRCNKGNEKFTGTGNQNVQKIRL